MNTLQSYLAMQGESLSGFAVRIGRAPSTLLRALDGKRNPSFSLARDVEVGTGGVVSATEFLALCMEAQLPLSSQGTPATSSTEVAP